MLLALFLSLASAPQAGKLHPSVACQAAPEQSYALYLPTAYREDRLWPVIFVFSPSGNGAEAAALFQEGAERLGWIVMASNGARNGPIAPIRAAQRALWKEGFSRFKADPKRVAAAGFSGGARMAMDLAKDHRDSFVGLMSIGAFGAGPTLGPSHLAHVLLCGEEDFNHAELAAAWERMRGSKDRLLWMEHFPGGHRWAPGSLMSEGMNFLSLSAGLQGHQSRNPEEEAAFLNRRLLIAQSSQGLEDRAQAYRRWKDVAALPGAPEAAAEQVRLLEKEYRSATQLDHSFSERSRRLQSSASYGAELKRLLEIAAGKGAEALDARRLLERERGNLEERCNQALEGREWDLALKLARGLVTLGDRGFRGGVYAAMALAQLGQKQDGLEELKAAIDRGYRSSRPLTQMPLLAPLQDEPRFRELQARSAR